MQLDLEPYRREVRVTKNPLVRISAIDIDPPRAKQTLVFLHGYGGKATQWKFQLSDFSSNNRAIAVDLRGHGQSDKPLSSYTMKELQGDLEKTLKILHVKTPFVLVGHSFGGAIAAEYAVAHPKNVSRLIIIATPGEFHLRRYYRFLLSLPYWLHVFIAPFVRNWVGAPPGVMKSLYYRTLRTWRGWETFAALRTPTLLIRGQRDRVFGQAQFRKVSESIRGIKELKVRAAGHLVMLERHEVVSRAIESFIRKAR